MDNIITYTTASGGPLVQGDTNATANTYAKRDGSAGLAVARLAATSVANTGPESFPTIPATITTTATLTGANAYERVDATGSSFTVTLPPAATVAGVVQRLKRIDSSGNTLTIHGNGSELIDGSASTTIAALGHLTLRSTGAAWDVV